MKLCNCYIIALDHFYGMHQSPIGISDLTEIALRPHTSCLCMHTVTPCTHTSVLRLCTWTLCTHTQAPCTPTSPAHQQHACPHHSQVSTMNMHISTVHANISTNIVHLKHTSALLLENVVGGSQSALVKVSWLFRSIHQLNIWKSKSDPEGHCLPIHPVWISILLSVCVYVCLSVWPSVVFFLFLFVCGCIVVVVCVCYCVVLPCGTGTAWIGAVSGLWASKEGSRVD
jgi:hypothetical protein